MASRVVIGGQAAFLKQAAHTQPDLAREVEIAL
jgi:hypothetical protein